MDTAGQEKFNAISESYYRKADCCLLVYDITSRSSFDKVKDYYIPKLKKDCKNILKVVLLGNKADLKDERKVSEKEGGDLAFENEFIFMESSCVDNYNVLDAFTALIEMTNNELKKGNVKSHYHPKNIELRGGEDKKKKDKCC